MVIYLLVMTDIAIESGYLQWIVPLNMTMFNSYVKWGYLSQIPGLISPTSHIFSLETHWLFNCSLQWGMEISEMCASCLQNDGLHGRINEPTIYKLHVLNMTGWSFGITFIVLYVGNHHPKLLLYFPEGLVYHQPD